jgi:hypothetical protein
MAAMQSKAPPLLPSRNTCAPAIDEGFHDFFSSTDAPYTALRLHPEVIQSRQMDFDVVKHALRVTLRKIKESAEALGHEL